MSDRKYEIGYTVTSDRFHEFFESWADLKERMFSLRPPREEVVIRPCVYSFEEASYGDGPDE